SSIQIFSGAPSGRHPAACTTLPRVKTPASLLSRRRAFFFQAEDGIRDRNVTGVQTCALPILGRRLATESAELGADDGKVLCGNLGESRHLGETRSGEEAPSGAVDDSHLDDVVDRASGRDRVRSA